MTEAKTAAFYRDKASRIKIPNQAFIDGAYPVLAGILVFKSRQPS